MSLLIHNIHGYNSILLFLESYAEECAHPLPTNSKFEFEVLMKFLLRRCCQIWNENYYPFEEGIIRRGAQIEGNNENRKCAVHFPCFETWKVLKECCQEGVRIHLANNIT
jgi:hypothetical protein